MNEVLRVAMAEKGETAESLAEKVGVDPKTAGRWLASGRIPHPRTRIAVAEVLGRDAAELWPEPFRRRDLPWFRPWAELEQDAVSIRSYEPSLVPGLLQTEGYPRRDAVAHRPRRAVRPDPPARRRRDGLCGQSASRSGGDRECRRC